MAARGSAPRSRREDQQVRSSRVTRKLGLVTAVAGFFVFGAFACSNGDSTGHNGVSGGQGATSAMGPSTKSRGPAEPAAAGAGTGGTSSSTAGTTSAGQGGTAGTTSSAGAGGSVTAGSTGVGGVAPATGGVTGISGNPASGGVSSASAGTSGAGGAAAGRAATTAGGAAGSGTAGSTGTPTWCLPISAHPQGVDWAKALVDSQIKANVSLSWQYPDGLFLHGVYLAYKRLNDASYLSFMKKWADANVSGQSSYDSLDSMQPTLVLDDMYRETQDAKYGKAPAAAATRLTTTYPTTSDGGFWHNTGATNQLWGDGVFMDLPPYVNYGDLFKVQNAVDIATQQLIIYDSHLAAPNDLHIHQWDGQAMKQSCCEWCRAEGWYEMALLIVLDFTPTTHKNYTALVAIAQRLAKGLAAAQDSATGRWWQVMDKASDNGNWLETSCTAMHAYFLSKASQKGYIDAATYAPLAIKGFNGEMQMVSNASNVQIKNICPGTGVLTSAADYYARPPATNDNHGLGAFLLMYDQLTCR
jgi:unsaturated rhamnogalacturonyl hydrolase